MPGWGRAGFRECRELFLLPFSVPVIPKIPDNPVIPNNLGMLECRARNVLPRLFPGAGSGSGDFFPLFSHLELPDPGISGNFVFPASGICWGCNPREIPRFPEPEFPSFGASGEGIDLPVFYPPGPGIPGNFPWKRPARGDSDCGKRGWKRRNWARDPKIWDWPLRLRKSGSCCGRKIPEGGNEELFYSRDLAAPGSRERLGRARSSLGRGKVSHGMGWDRIPSEFRDSVPRSRIPQEEPEPGHSVRSQLWGFFGNSGRFQLE